MQSIEFEAIAHNGTIAIPEQYREVLPERARVLVRIEPVKDEQQTSRTFKAIRISTKGFKFNRQEANER